MSDGSLARWWTLALSHDVLPAKPVAAIADGVEIVLFRDAVGTVHALLDQCAHRRAPLSLGSVTEAGLIECPYHGWRYDGATGGCRNIPNLPQAEKVPRSYRVPTFAAEERDGFVHVWSKGDATPDAQPPALMLSGDMNANSGQALIAFPHESCVDLLLDAPGALVDIAGVTVVNDHRFGDPIVTDGYIHADYAAFWTASRLKAPVADYPLTVRVVSAIDGGHAHVAILDATGASLAQAVIALTPVRRSLCLAHWRSVGLDADARSARIGVKRIIDPAIVRGAVDYVSRLRHDDARPEVTS